MTAALTTPHPAFSQAGERGVWKSFPELVFLGMVPRAHIGYNPGIPGEMESGFAGEQPDKGLPRQGG
jgi:hypothetical protein